VLNAEGSPAMHGLERVHVQGFNVDDVDLEDAHRVGVGRVAEAVGDKKGIARYGHSSVPMEETIANVSLDLSGRSSCVYKVDYRTDKIGDFDVECIEEMLKSFSNNGKFNLHVNVPYGSNSHHMAEAIFKALGQSLGAAVKIVGGDVPSTKGIL